MIRWLFLTCIKIIDRFVQSHPFGLLDNSQRSPAALSLYNITNLATSQENKAYMELWPAAVGSLLPKLGTILSDEYKLQKMVRGEIRFLKAEMESMQAALNRVSKLPAHQIMILTRSGRGT